MLHAGLPTGIDWHNQDALAVGKIAQVMSFILLFLSINHSLLHIVQASARSKQLKYYKGNWATVEIMKTLLRNRHSYQKHIGHLDVDKKDPTSKDINRQDDDDWEEMYVKSKTDNNKGNEDENGCGGGNKYKDGNSGGVVDGGGKEEEEFNNEGRNREGSSGGVDGDGNEEEEDNNNNEGRSREGSSGAEKRQMPQDDEPAAATRLKRKKIDDSMDHQAAI